MAIHGTNRRQFILGSSALLAGAGLTTFGIQSFAVTKVPTIDTLDIKVLVDSSYDSPRPGTNKWVKIKRTPFISSKDYRKALHNEWGLALALESKIGQSSKSMLLDYGYTPAALMGNMEIMNVKPEQQHAMILSHGHFDHFGGRRKVCER